MLGTGLVLPAEARTNRAHKLHRKHSRRRIHIPRMLPTFIPAAREGYATVLRGRASWYGKYFQGKKTTSGERFNRHEYTCAHKTLPFGTRLRVTNVDNGVTVVVRVSDRGPFRHERIIDLAEVAARPLGLVEAGAATVVAEIVDPATPLGLTATPGNLEQLQAGDPNPHAPFTAYLLPELEASAAVLAAAPTVATPASVGPLVAAAEAAPRFLVQAGSYTDTQRAHATLARILTIDQSLPAEIVTTTVNGQPVSRVVVGQLDSWLAAETVRRNLQLWGLVALVCQVPGGPTVASAAKAAAPLALAGPVK
ncbi:MAG: septal ring lytic transglycosylase RlpA family protein [Janthinobacterium lividum]